MIGKENKMKRNAKTLKFLTAQKLVQWLRSLHITSREEANTILSTIGPLSASAASKFLDAWVYEWKGPTSDFLSYVKLNLGIPKYIKYDYTLCLTDENVTAIEIFHENHQGLLRKVETVTM